MSSNTTPPNLPEAAEDPSFYLTPGEYADSDHPAVVEFAQRVVGNATATLQKAVSLYYAVRDDFLYDPYHFDTSKKGLKASHVIEVGRGFCVPKATLLVAAARAVGIPARLRFADVRNHLTSTRLFEMMGTDLFVFHGYVELWIHECWVKATPTFNRSLCEKAGIRPLDFDGQVDSVFHEFNVSGRRHMEYLRDRGTYFDLPRDELLVSWRENYKFFDNWCRVAGSDVDFQQEVNRES